MKAITATVLYWVIEPFAWIAAPIVLLAIWLWNWSDINRRRCSK